MIMTRLTGTSTLIAQLVRVSVVRKRWLEPEPIAANEQGSIKPGTEWWNGMELENI